MINWLIATSLTVTSPTIPSKSQFYVSGTIDENMASQVVSWLATGGKDLIVDSVGGSEEAALTIAEEMVKIGNVNVRISGICSSACSQYILPAAKTVSATEQSLIGYHISSFAMKELIYNYESIFSHSEIESIKVITKRTVNLYRSVNKSTQILLDAAYFSYPLCVQKKHLGVSEIVLSQDIWVPDAVTLKKYQIVSSTINLPRSGPEAFARAGHFLKTGTRLGYGSAQQLPNQQKLVREIKICGR